MGLGVRVMAWLILGLAAGLAAAPGAAQELRWSCNGDHDGARAAAEAQGCAEQRFDRAPTGADGLAQDQFAAAFDADELREQFAQVDEDGDGRISREEWMRSFGPAQAGTREGAGSRPVGSD